MDYQFQKYVLDVCVLIFVLSISFYRKVKALNTVVLLYHLYLINLSLILVQSADFLSLMMFLSISQVSSLLALQSCFGLLCET